MGLHRTKRTMKRLDLSEEPIEPTPPEIQLPELVKGPLLVYLWVVGKLSTLNETEDDCVFEPSQNGTNPVEREGVPGEPVVGLHDWRVEGGGEGMSAETSPLARTYIEPSKTFSEVGSDSLRLSDRSRAIGTPSAALGNTSEEMDNWDHLIGLYLETTGHTILYNGYKRRSEGDARP